MKRIEDFTVEKVTWLNKSNYLIEMKPEGRLPGILPGNFAEIEITNSPLVFLRRPFSIFDADHKRSTLTFYIKIIGEGTRKLSQMQVGEKTNLIYPLGNSFGIPEEGPVLITAGGSGIAPFLMLARQLRKSNIPSTFLFGGKTEEDIVLTEQFKPYGDVEITTEDGSLGEKGLITAHSIFKRKDFPYKKIYSCGPELMMQAIARIAHQMGTDCEVSLENLMACGFGACLCCIVETHEGNKCVCTEGPVFNTKELAWQI